MTDQNKLTPWTPGPYKIARLNLQGIYMNDGSVTILGQDDAGEAIPIAQVSATVDFPRGKGHALVDPQRDATAHLIAAAPALYEATAQLEGWIARVLEPSFTDRKPMPENLCNALDAARAALALARGDQ